MEEWRAAAAADAAMREEDSEGKLGVSLKRNILQVTREILQTHISDVCSQILLLSEKIRIGLSVLQKKVFGKSRETQIDVPNLKSVVHHFCLPTSGRLLIREILKGLKLGGKDEEAALMTVHRFGNQSSASLWYDFLSCFQLVSKTAALPIWKTQLRSSLDRSRPGYQPVDKISVLRMTALEFLWVLRRIRAKSMATMLALHPIPERLKLLVSLLMEKRLMSMEEREGEGQKPLQLTMRMSIWVGERWVLAKRCSKTSNRTIWASAVDSRWMDFGGM